MFLYIIQDHIFFLRIVNLSLDNVDESVEQIAHMSLGITVLLRDLYKRVSILKIENGLLDEIYKINNIKWLECWLWFRSFVFWPNWNFTGRSSSSRGQFSLLSPSNSFSFNSWSITLSSIFEFKYYFNIFY